MSTRTSSLASGALAVALALTGCSSGDDGAPTAAASPSPAGLAAGSVASTDELRAMLEAAGVPCEEPDVGTFPGAVEAQSCIVNDAEDVVLLQFASAADKQAYLDAKEELSSAVVGDNWAIQTVLVPTAEQIQAAIGGELVAGPSTEEP